MASHENDSTPKRSRKKEIASFLHDCNARNDQKMLRLRSRGGWAWYGIYWACIEVMREASDYRIHPEAIDGVALSLGVRDVEFHEFLSFCAQLELFKHDSGGYYSESLVRRMERYEEKINKCKKAAEKSVENRLQKRQVLTLVPTEHPLNGRSTDAATDAERPFSLNNINRTITINRTESGSGSGSRAREYLTTLVQALPEEVCDTAAAFHDAVAAALEGDGWFVRREVETFVPSVNRSGRIDIFASRDSDCMAIELDNITPRGKSILKLMTFEGARLAVVRASREVFEIGAELATIEPQELPPAYDDDPATWTAFRREAEDALEPVTAQISQAPGFVALRRRPMKKYPELWLTGQELATVTERILEAGITIGDRPRVFAKASAHAKKQITAGKEPSRMNAYGWLLGFCLTATLQEIDAANRAATSGEYLKQAKGRK